MAANEHPRKYPFQNMRLADYSALDKIEGRQLCSLCNRSRKFFCYSPTCNFEPVQKVAEIIPKVEIPIKIDIIKHEKEIDGKSSAIHAAVLGKGSVNLYTYPDIPDYSKEEGVILIFPSATSLTVSQLFHQNIRLEAVEEQPHGFNMGTMLRKKMLEVVDEAKDTEAEPLEDASTKTVYNCDNLPIRKAVFIDSTWHQCRGIFKDEKLRTLPTVVLQNRLSQFWRHQKKSPRWYLATIEAIHQFLLELHVNAWGLNPNYRGLDNLEIDKSFFENVKYVDAEDDSVGLYDPYNGQYDNLMFFFANMYDLIHKYYDHNELKSYKRPI